MLLHERSSEILRWIVRKKILVQSPAQTIEYYRQFGFFSGQATEAILAEAREEWGREPSAGTSWDDVFLLRYEKSIASHGDPEADVCSGNDVYRRTLKEWGRITGGVFNPLEIKEEWQSDIGPIKVSFLLKDQPVVIRPNYHDDWIDLEILLELNRIVGGGKRFNCAVDGNFYLLTFLSLENETRLRRERGFPFALP